MDRDKNQVTKRVFAILKLPEKRPRGGRPRAGLMKLRFIPKAMPNRDTVIPIVV